MLGARIPIMYHYLSIIYLILYVLSFIDLLFIIIYFYLLYIIYYARINFYPVSVLVTHGQWISVQDSIGGITKKKQ